MMKANRFVMCIDNRGNEVDLAIGKVYPALRSQKNDGKDLVRVIDDSGEDYLFAADQFVEVKLPRAGKEAVLRTLTSDPGL